MDTLVLNSDLMPVNQLPLSTIKWDDAIKAVYLDSVSVIAEYEDWEVHSPSVTMRVPSVIMTRRYLHFQRKIAFTPEQLYLRDRYTCQYCRKVFPEHKLTMDHVLPRKFGGKTTWENISTSCGPCNFKKGSNQRIVPSVMPVKPTYFQLLAIRKEYPLAIPCEQWIDYLDWPAENLFVKEKTKKILQLDRAA
jgi:5-methylcytosine-specific restriction endonuclease McrA